MAGIGMDEEGKLGLKIFLQCGAFLAALSAFNLYAYYRGGSRMFLAVGIVGICLIIGWAGYYIIYVRGKG